MTADTKVVQVDFLVQYTVGIIVFFDQQIDTSIQGFARPCILIVIGNDDESSGGKVRQEREVRIQLATGAVCP